MCGHFKCVRYVFFSTTVKKLYERALLDTLRNVVDEGGGKEIVHEHCSTETVSALPHGTTLSAILTTCSKNER